MTELKLSPRFLLGLFATLIVMLFATAVLLLQYGTTPRVAYGGGVIVVLVNCKLILYQM